MSDAMAIIYIGLIESDVLDLWNLHNRHKGLLCEEILYVKI